MPRHEFCIGNYRHSFCTATAITEIYTHKMTLPDGRLVRWDGKDLWSIGNYSWYGSPPEGWDKSKAVESGFALTFSEERDYS